MGRAGEAVFWAGFHGFFGLLTLAFLFFVGYVAAGVVLGGLLEQVWGIALADIAELSTLLAVGLAASAGLVGLLALMYVDDRRFWIPILLLEFGSGPLLLAWLAPPGWPGGDLEGRFLVSLAYFAIFWPVVNLQARIGD